MTEEDRHARWSVMMVQARNFASRENFHDAVGRAREVVAEVEAAIAAEHSSNERFRCERVLSRARRELATMEHDLEAWRTKIAVRREATIANAPEEMTRPIPSGLPP